MKKFLLPLFLCIVATFNVAPIYAQEYASLENTTYAVIETKSDILQWVFKTENGKMYKRLYNYSTAEWIGDWIYVCDYPG